ncbi:MAG: protein kinase, partial [Acidobacteriota bacterium]|nr:protein kinase [Acidobacteriota bacterium]
MTVAAGSRLGKYEIVAPLGAGGMGEVYRALDPHLRREVAIKILHADVFTDSSRRKRLEQEARAAGALNHPNLLTIYDLGSHDGAPFIVSELLVGQTLRSALEGGALPSRTATAYAAQIAAGLEAAHDKGIIHRDLKPENLFVTTDSRVKILDFGLAKLNEPIAHDDSTETIVRTEPGTVIGTLAYMAPEQVKALGADERSDIFAFGSILFEMLWGKPAFRKKSGGETIAAILTADPIGTPPAEVPAGLISIVRHCLEKDPDRRFQTAHDLAFALESASALSATIPLAAPRAKRRSMLAGGAVLAALIIAALIIPLRRLWPREPHIDSIAVLPLGDLNGGNDRYFADGLTEELTTRLAQIHALRVVPRTSTSRYVDTKKSLRDIGHELDVDAVLTGSVQRSGDKIRVNAQLSDTETERSMWAEHYERPIGDVLALQDDLARTIAERIRVQMTPSEQQRLKSSPVVSPEAHDAYLRGRSYFNRSDPESLSRGLQYFKEAVQRDPKYAAAYAGIADSYEVMASFGILLPREAFPVAKEAALTALKLDPNLAEAHVSLGSIETQYDWNWKTAEDEFRRAIELNPSYDLAHDAYAHLLMVTGRPNDAIAESKRAFELSPLGRQAIEQLPWMLYLARKYPAAILQYQKAMELDPDSIETREGAADAYAAAGRSAEAFALYQQWARMAGYPQPIIEDLSRSYISGG